MPFSLAHRRFQWLYEIPVNDASLFSVLYNEDTDSVFIDQGVRFQSGLEKEVTL